MMSAIATIGSKYRRARMELRVGTCLAKAAATAVVRRIDPTRPSSWEFSGFSQNGEDGIIDYLASEIVVERNRYFVEIGVANGLQNNSAWLAFAKNWSGLMIEGSPEQADMAKLVTSSLLGVQVMQAFVDTESLPRIVKSFAYKDPDVFSLDIDGVDYYVAKGLLDLGVRPRIFALEYNSAYGPDVSRTVLYDARFDMRAKSPSHLYYGCSVGGWRKLFEAAGYQFVTVDTNGVNAFFVDRAAFAPEFLASLRGDAFRENFFQRLKFGAGWQDQFARIKSMQFVDV